METLKPVLSSLSDTVRRLDTAPRALTAKLTNNLLLLSEVVALAEAFAVGRSGGLSDDQLRDLLANNPLLPNGLRNRFEGVLTGSHDGWWTTVLGAKDAGLAIDIARVAGVALPSAEVIRDLYDRAASSGHHDADIARRDRALPEPVDGCLVKRTSKRDHGDPLRLRAVRPGAELSRSVPPHQGHPTHTRSLDQPINHHLPWQSAVLQVARWSRR